MFLTLRKMINTKIVYTSILFLYNDFLSRLLRRRLLWFDKSTGAQKHFGDQLLNRYISVRVVDAGGKPANYAKVVLYVSQTLASGPLPEKYTNSEGLAEFEADLDAFAQVSVSVNGQERVRSGPIQADYKVTL